MLFNYIKISLRHLWKNRLYSFINLSGLAIGITTGTLILLFLQKERSYDHFHEKADKIFLVSQSQLDAKEGKSPEWRHNAWLPTPLGPGLQAEIPEIRGYCRYSRGESGLLLVDGKSFSEELQFVDGNFFEMFSFPLLRGERKAVYATPESVVITEAVAEKVFGSVDVVGKTLTVNTFENVKDYTVSAVAANPPSNTSLFFSVLIQTEQSPFYDWNKDNWNSFNNPVFVEVADPKVAAGLTSKLEKFAEAHVGKTIGHIRERLQVGEAEKVFSLNLLPITKLHLTPEIHWHGASNPLYSYILAGLALLVLAIACINYILLALSTSSGRTQEVGIRKVIGAGRWQLAGQFWGESFVLALIALLVSLQLTQLALPHFNALTDSRLELSDFPVLSLTGTLVAVTLLVSLAAGSYPAFWLSRFRPAGVLRNRQTYHFNSRLTKGLVVFQFSLSAFLITASVIMNRQLDFIAQKDLGFDEEMLLTVPTYTGWSDEGEKLLNRFGNAVSNELGIVSVCGTSHLPTSMEWSRLGFEVEGKNFEAFAYRVSHDYVKTMGLTLVAGRDFSKENPTDTMNAVLINEAAAEKLGWDDPIGKTFPWREEKKMDVKVVGVLKNFHNRSLESTIDPVFLYMDGKSSDKIYNLLVRISPDDVPGTLASLERNWKNVAPDKPFDFSFLDEKIAAQYSLHQRWMRIMSTATLLAIFIACLGLFGLAGIQAVNRTKEIGIRKIMGASVANVVALLSKDFVRFALIAIVIASPVAWYLGEKWLSNFAFRIEVSWWMFALAGAVAVTVAFFTVGVQGLKAALANPVESLRSE